MHDVENSIFYSKHGVIWLSDMENRILDLLLKNKGQLVKYKQIAKKIYKETDSDKIRNAISTNICRLRAKLKGEIDIKSRRNWGYWIDE